MNMHNSQKPPLTKLVEVRLSALTRVEFTEVVQVPANVTQQELTALVNERYRNVEAGEFTNDPEYWERGTCYVVDADLDDATPSVMATRTSSGLLVEPYKAGAPSSTECPRE